jgi:hypothetical protein
MIDIIALFASPGWLGLTSLIFFFFFFLLGRASGRKKERALAQRPIELVCTCGHGFGSHEDGARCQAEIQRADKWDEYRDAKHWEYVPCPCRTYDGPDPMLVNGWTPPKIG